jgi:predicted nucleic acid-binding protein
MIRVVIDTNILVPALLTPRGAPAEGFPICLLQPDFQLCVSGDRKRQTLSALWTNAQIVSARAFLDAAL